jgi:hypothetical protein
MAAQSVTELPEGDESASTRQARGGRSLFLVTHIHIYFLVSIARLTPVRPIPLNPARHIRVVSQRELVLVSTLFRCQIHRQIGVSNGIPDLGRPNVFNIQLFGFILPSGRGGPSRIARSTITGPAYRTRIF